MMAKTLTDANIAEAAQALGCVVAQIKAVIEVETAGKSGFLEGGRPRILYEPHVFYRCTDGRYGERKPISARSWGRWPYGSYTEQWRRFEEAAQLDREAAIMACSWGLFQILGEGWRSLGYDSAKDFCRRMHASEAEHLDAFRRFVQANNLTDALSQGGVEASSWRAFARRYNGSGYESHDYHGRLARAYVRARQSITQTED